MKSLKLVATFVAATLPFSVIIAGDSSKPEMANQKQEQGCDNMRMKGMGKMTTMSNWKDQDAQLDKLVADMNNATADKKLDAVTAVLVELVAERKAMHQQMQDMMSADDKGGMRMCHMMMGMKMEDSQSGEPSHHQ